MSKYCTKCGTKLEDTDDFCSNCGTSLNNSGFAQSQRNSSPNYKMLIFIAIGLIAILFIGAMLLSSMGSGIPLVHADFEAFEMDVPEGSNIEIYQTFSDSIIYENNGAYPEDISTMTVSTEPIEPTLATVLVEENDDMALYKVNENSRLVKEIGTVYYELSCQKDGIYFNLGGTNPDLLKEISETIELKNTN